MRREAQVVEHREDRRAVAHVEIDEQLHRPDLVAEVEVDRRLVEDEDRRGLGDGEREQDELPLAERQLARVAPEEVPDADALDRRRDRGPIGRPRRRGSGPRGAAGRAPRPPRPASRTAASPAAGRRRAAGRSPPRSSRSIGVPSSDARPAAGSTSPVRTRRSVDLPAPFGPMSATRSPAAMSRSHAADARPGRGTRR